MLSKRPYPTWDAAIQLSRQFRFTGAKQSGTISCTSYVSVYTTIAFAGFAIISSSSAHDSQQSQMLSWRTCILPAVIYFMFVWWSFPKNNLVFYTVDTLLFRTSFLTVRTIFQLFSMTDLLKICKYITFPHIAWYWKYWLEEGQGQTPEQVVKDIETSSDSPCVIPWGALNLASVKISDLPAKSDLPATISICLHWWLRNCPTKEPVNTNTVVWSSSVDTVIDLC